MMKQLNQSYFDLQMMPLVELMSYLRILEEQKDDEEHQMEKSKNSNMSLPSKYGPLG